jgi:Nuclease-related domain
VTVPLTGRLRIVENQDRNTPRTEGEQHLLDSLRNAPLDGWTVYEQPHLNGDRPDFVLVHPERGVILIEVKDYNLATGRYAHNDRQFCVLGNDGRWHPKRNPADQVKDVQKNILELYSGKFLGLEAAHGTAAWGVVEAAVYFHHADASQAAAVCGRPDTVRFLDRNHVQAMQDGAWARTGINALKAIATWPRSSFAKAGLLQEFVADLESWLNPAAYMQERRAAIPFTPEQARNALPAPGIHRRLRGAAGSGKSVVLASRAAALLAQGKRVMLVTFNITLLHYLRDLVAQQTAPEHWPAMRDQFVIYHYHGLLKWLAGKHDIVMTRSSDDMSSEEVDRILSQVQPEQVNHGIAACAANGELDPDAQFDAILIDEAQDFEREWVTGLLPLLTGNDEMLLAYDNFQNLYQRDLVWIEKDNRGMGFSGRPATLTKSQRLPRPFVEVSAAFVKQFIDQEFQVESKNLPPETLTKHFLNWQNVRAEVKTEFPGLVYSAVQTLKKQFNAHPHDIAVITDGNELALPVIERLQEEAFEVTHVFDLSGENSFRARRAQKWRFQPGDGLIKVCTLHSFKGWEAPYVILLLSEQAHQDLEERAFQVYVALTRVKVQADGASSALLVYNLDPQLNAGEKVVREIAGQQSGAFMPRQRAP